MMKNNIYSIPSELPFADTLAKWVLAEYGAEPHKMARVQILLPSRRAGLSLREAFLRATEGRPLLLPRMQPLGDVPEDWLLAMPFGSIRADLMPPPPAFEYKRLFILARLIRQEREAVLGYKEPADHAVRLAVELARLLDETERDQVSLAGLGSLVPESFAEHWQVTVEFLKLLSEHWPKIAAEQGIVGPEQYRRDRLGALAHHWQQSPPDYPVIAAGTTGSIPATAELLKVISKLPEGRVILPGLDTYADEGYLERTDESHPQWGVRHLLAELETDRKDVTIIPEKTISERVKLLSEVMRPSDTSDSWQHVELDMDQALSGLKRIECANVQEEANVIALMLREVLETPAMTAALVTHDRSLARRVVAIMNRFGVSVDDSAGAPLLETPAAGFLRLILETMQSRYNVVSLLSLLKHPFTHAGMERFACLEAARALEMLCLRGVQLSSGIDGIRQSLSQHGESSSDMHTLLNQMEATLAPLSALFACGEAYGLAEWLEKHIQCAEALAGKKLWSGNEGDALADIISELTTAAQNDASLNMDGDTYPPLFEVLLSGKVIRPEYGMHPRLKILSPIEARMQSFDRIILGGLNEGNWPPAITSDPWFNRPMRAAIGLPAPERQTGLAAHDFYMLAAAPEVVLTRAEKVDGVPTTPARWLVKLDVLLSKFSATDRLQERQWLSWAEALNAAEKPEACQPPAPRPPLKARPRELSVTQIETWMRDPYSLYALKILGLKALETLGEDPHGAHFGNAVHSALESFVNTYPEKLPADAYEQLLKCGRTALQPLFFNPAVEALWWPRFKRIARFVLQQERQRRADIKKVWTEVKGSYLIKGFTLTGWADRVEELPGGGLAIIDYKTGTLPKKKEIEEGLANQLVLLALIAQEDGMPITGFIKALEYWKLSGSENKGEIEAVAEDKIQLLIDSARQGLQELINRYNDPAFPYYSTPIPARARRYNDYEHLARVKEWS